MKGFRFTVLAWVLLLGGLTATAQLPAPPVPGAPPTASLTPPLPTSPSPVGMFRRLLSMSLAERESYLANRPPQIRAALRAKISEYLALDADTRELRLRATELRWQLTPLLHLAPADRASRLALIPDDLVALVQSRLAEWDQLPPAVQAEFLANDRTLHYFAQVAGTNQTGTDLATVAQQQTIAAHFNQFFELTPAEKQKTLKTLSATERGQMEQTLQAFSHLPVQQRAQCLRAFTEFAGMSAGERAEFLRNAGSWAQMSPQERQTWRDLVARVPSWPPVPGALSQPPLPPTPPVPAKNHAAMATN